MNKKSKNRFTIKIMLSYIVLCALALISGYFIFLEIRVFLSNETTEDIDSKLLKTGSLATQLYEAESLSKLALQSKPKANFSAYAQKIDSIYVEINKLKQIIDNDYQHILLDSVQLLLRQQIENSNSLRNLKVQNDAHNPIDNALKEFSKMEASLGKITAEGLAPNINQLSPKAQKAIRDLADYLNANIPKDTSSVPNHKKIDSILNTSKALLAKAKRNDAKTQRFLSQKEKEINQTHLELSQQLRTILSSFEQETIVNAYSDNLKRQSMVRRSIRLAIITALLGFIIVGIFTFLINRDFWRVQTYRQKLEKEKKYSESLLKSREQLISTVSHDLRTPLSTITGYTELMENTSVSAKQERYLKNIKSASEYVGSLINDLLDFSKLEAGKLNIEKVPFVPYQLIQETAENIENQYAVKNLKLQLDIDQSLQNVVLGDPFRIRQILTNLIGNAFKFTEKGSITIKGEAIDISEEKFTLKIAVIDTGIGIAKNKRHLIFDEFTQAESTTEKKFGGYGLGLAISKKLTKLLNGYLTLDSKKGEGSVFTLCMPLNPSNRTVTPEDKITLVQSNLSILIIDDDHALLSMLKEMAESIGIKVHTFSNFSDIEKNSDLEYNLVLTDIQMPTISGFEVLKELHSGKYRHYQDQPIIAMTGRRDLKIETYSAEGFINVLQKPFTKSELLNTLNGLGIKPKTIASAKKVFNNDDKPSPIYNLDIIHSFLGENEHAVQDILQTFVDDTHANMKSLKEAIKTEDYESINQIAHRMLPMFRQLKVNSVIGTLENLELIVKDSQIQPTTLNDKFKKINTGVNALIAALEKRFSISPSYND